MYDTNLTRILSADRRRTLTIAAETHRIARRHTHRSLRRSELVERTFRLTRALAPPSQ